MSTPSPTPEPADHPDVREAFDELRKIRRQRLHFLARSNPDLASRFFQVLDVLHDMTEGIDGLIASLLEEEGYPPLPAPDHRDFPPAFHRTLDALADRATKGDEEARHLFWLVEMQRVSLQIHDAVCEPRKAAQIAGPMKAAGLSDFPSPN